MVTAARAIARSASGMIQNETQVRVETIDELAARGPDGAQLAVPPDYSGCAMAAVRALIRRGVKALHLVGVPQVRFQGDMLIGAGCVATLETAALTLGYVFSERIWGAMDTVVGWLMY